MSGSQRILVTGMGGQLGGEVARRLAARSDVEAVLGLDIHAPPGRIAGTEFARVDPRNRVRSGDVVRDFEPTALVHLGLYEPNARCSPGAALERSISGTLAVVGAAAECGTLDRVVVRSGIEVYGRRRGAATCPDEDVTPSPSSGFGHVQDQVERLTRTTLEAADVPLAMLRFAPLVGPSFPSPLGRYLRLPVIPVALGGLPFSLLHQTDAAESVVRAFDRGYDGPLNVVGPGAVNAWQAVRLGARVPVPVVGPGWLLAAKVAELSGAPLPEHVRELLTRGRVADGGRAATELGFVPAHTTPDVVKHLFDWAPVTYLDTTSARAA